ISSDFYPLCVQQTKPDGSFQWPDVTAAVANGTRLLKQWFFEKQVWAYVECCNQDICQAGAPGYDFEHTGLRFVGSKAPTPDQFPFSERQEGHADADGQGVQRRERDQRLHSTVEMSIKYKGHLVCTDALIELPPVLYGVTWDVATIKATVEAWLVKWGYTRGEV